MRRNETPLNVYGSPIQKPLHRFRISLLPNISRPVALLYLTLRRPLSNFWREEMAGEKKLYDLGINTTLSRKLSHF